MIDDLTNNIKKLFENKSPKSPSTPYKTHQKSDCFEEITNKQTCSKPSKVLVHDTPTPFMSRKTQIKYSSDDFSDSSQKQIVSSIKITRRIIPNTPVVQKNNESVIFKKVDIFFFE